MRKAIILIIICFTYSFSFAQSEAANWYFGRKSGIKFNQFNNSVISVSDSQLNTFEGCATISDDSGNLLFYTDGITVWNKTHAVMSNGRNLFGDSSSTQSAIIVPKPNDSNIYYIFTVDNHSRNSFHYGLNYSEVDLTKDGGLGEITTKNTNLLQECSEKITAVLKDCVSKSIWVLAYASENGNLDSRYNTFHAFEVNSTGVSNTSVKSTFPVSVSDDRGYLKLSPDGTKMACANVSGGLYIYDFDSSTGVVNNEKALFIGGRSRSPYGVEFSPNSTLLYVHSSNDFFGADSDNPVNHSSVLVQYNLLAPDIERSFEIIDDRQLYRGGLQLGPNGKIYRALSATYGQGLPYLGVINNPNEIGTNCNYEHNAISLFPNTSSQGLPPFIQSFFNTKIDIIQNGRSTTNLALCLNNSYTLAADEILGATYTWTLDDKPLPQIDFNLKVTTSGHYKVYIDPNNGDCAIEGEAYVIFNENPIAFNGTLLQCDKDGLLDGLTQFNLNQANSILTGGITDFETKFYIDKARTTQVDGSAFSNTSNPQTIYAEVINSRTGCYDYSELTLNVSLTTSNNIDILAVCDDDGIEDGLHLFNLTNLDNAIVGKLPIGGLDISYFETYNDALLEVNTLENTFTNSIPYSQTIYARVENENNCYSISEVLLSVNELPNINTEDLTYYCLNIFPQTISLNAGIIADSPHNYTYNWSHGDTTYETQINQPETYTVTVTNVNGCSRQRNITVEVSNIATINTIEVVDASQNNTITILANGEGVYEYRLLDENNTVYADYQESNVFENVSPGIYTVNVGDIKNNCGTISDRISVIGFPKFFTPNNDGVNDTWQVIGTSSMFQPNSNILIFNRFGKLLKQLTPLGSGWDGRFNGEKLPVDDYWFTVILQDGRIFKNHFTLKH